MPRDRINPLGLKNPMEFQRYVEYLWNSIYGLDALGRWAYDWAMKHSWPVILCVLALLVASCGGGKTVRAEDTAEDVLPEGQYGLFMFEAEGPEGKERVFVILDIEGDEYEFVPPEDEGEQRRQEQVSADEALKEAAILFGTEPPGVYHMRRIIIEDIPIGYEIIPEDSYPTAHPLGNILRIYYRMDREGKVHFNARPLPLLEPVPTGEGR